MREELGAQVQLVRCVWHEDLPHVDITLWGWHATLVAPELTPDPSEVSEVLWLTSEEARSHPDALPSTAPFMEALLWSEQMTASALRSGSLSTLPPPNAEEP